jgi:uncharacterized membrane protein
MLTNTLVRGVFISCAVIGATAVASAQTAQSMDVEESVETTAGTFQLDERQYERENQELPFEYGWDSDDERINAFAAPRVDEFDSNRLIDESLPAPAIVPEPGTMVLLAGGLAAMAVRRIRRLS